VSNQANAYTDCWSANIVDTNPEPWVTPARHSQVGSGGWEGLPREYSGEHVPSVQSLQAWLGAWEAEPSHGWVHGHDSLGGSRGWMNRLNLSVFLARAASSYHKP
jgi:hypothetical protein